MVAVYFCSTSCTVQRKMIYFQGSIQNADSNRTYSPVFRADDLLSITVMGIDEQVVKPFNLFSGNMNPTTGGYAQGAPSPPGYLIDSNGLIDFPVIGKIKIGGLTRNEAIDMLKEKLKPYLANPTIIIRILNYKITVLGEVKNPGTFTIPNERITVLEALGIAGDLQITGVRKNVIVIRDINGKKTETIINLTKKDLFNSNAYYLQQNDVVYVQPNRAKINSSVVNTANVSLVISIISLFVTMGILFTK